MESAIHNVRTPLNRPRYLPHGQSVAFGKREGPPARTAGLDCIPLFGLGLRHGMISTWRDACTERGDDGQHCMILGERLSRDPHRKQYELVIRTYIAKRDFH
jgi:hypothetical protein